MSGGENARGPWRGGDGFSSGSDEQKQPPLWTASTTGETTRAFPNGSAPSLTLLR